jgi:hypothetical protein
VNIAILGRITLELEGERITVAPWTVADLAAAQAGDIEALEAFAAHIEEPADALERGLPWVGAACNAWRAEVDALMDRLRVPANRAARRRFN